MTENNKKVETFLTLNKSHPIELRDEIVEIKDRAAYVIKLKKIQKQLECEKLALDKTVNEVEDCVSSYMMKQSVILEKLEYEKRKLQTHAVEVKKFKSCFIKFKDTTQKIKDDIQYEFVQNEKKIKILTLIIRVLLTVYIALVISLFTGYSLIIYHGYYPGFGCVRSDNRLMSIVFGICSPPSSH